MEISWESRTRKLSDVVVACDVGGTKTDLGLVGIHGGRLEVICRTQLKSQEMKGLEAPLLQFLKEICSGGESFCPQAIAVSAAGPVKNNHCKLTNCGFTISARALEQKTTLKTFLMNDFLAMAWGILTIDINQARSAIPIPHSREAAPDGPSTKPNTVKLVIGPGTGLGISYVVPGEGGLLPQSSEGGHITMAPFDSQSGRFHEFLLGERDRTPTAEMCISGQGIGNIYRFLRSEAQYPVTETVRHIDEANENERARRIAEHCAQEPICSAAMAFFARYLGSYSANMAAIFLPHGGIYLTGGIARKNASFLARSPHFMSLFENHPEPHIAKMLREISVYTIIDRDVSLLGAAASALASQGIKLSPP